MMTDDPDDTDDLELRRWREDGKAPAGSCPYCASRISMVERDGFFRARCSHRGCGATGPKMRSITRAADLFCCPPQRTAGGMAAWRGSDRSTTVADPACTAPVTIERTNLEDIHTGRPLYRVTCAVHGLIHPQTTGPNHWRVLHERGEEFRRALEMAEGDARRHLTSFAREAEINADQRARIATLEDELAQARAHRCGCVVLNAEDADRIAALLEEQPGPTPAMLALFAKAKE